MQAVRFGMILVATFVVVSSNAFAQESDYNDALKTQLKQEDTPATPPKKIVHKKIRKASANSKTSQSTKLAAQKKAMARNVKVAQTESNVSHINVEPVQAKNVQPAKEEELDAPVLGESAVQAPTTPQQTLPTYQPIFILQPAQAQMAAAQPAQVTPAPAVAAQVQPTTTVDAATVPEPRSEQLRLQRQDLEHQTESKLIEKLEDDRLSAEKERADKLFNPQAAPTPASSPAVVAPVAAPAATAPAPVVAPVTAVEVAEPLDKESVAAPAPVAPAAGTVSATPATPAAQVEVLKDPLTPAPVAAPALSGETKAATDANPVKDEDIKRFSVGAEGGLPSYPSIGNVISYYSLGAIGTYNFAEHLALQAEFDYSKFAINNVYFCPFCFGGTLVKGMDQYDISLGVRYTPFTFGSLTPVGGVVIDYARRNYYDLIDYGYTFGTPTGSNAFDAGLMVGLDLNISKSVILGAQFKYLWNVSYWTDNPLAYGLYGPIYGSPIESLSYSMATLNVRFLF